MTEVERLALALARQQARGLPFDPSAGDDQGYLEDILDQVEQRLVDKLRLDPSLVHLTLTPDGPVIPKAQTFVTIYPSDFPIDQRQFAGGGRTPIVAEGTLEINLWIRIMLDKPGTATKALKDQSRGALIKLRALIDALTWNPADAWQATDQQTGLLLWQEPMRLLRFSLIPKQPEPDLRRFETTWELKYKMKLP